MQDGYFIVVKEKLLSSGQPVTIPMFNTLLQVYRSIMYLLSLVSLSLLVVVGSTITSCY